MDPLADANNPKRTHEYEGRSIGRCHACNALEAAQDQYKDADRPGSLHYTVDRRERVVQPRRGKEAG